MPSMSNQDIKVYHKGEEGAHHVEVITADGIEEGLTCAPYNIWRNSANHCDFKGKIKQKKQELMENGETNKNTLKKEPKKWAKEQCHRTKVYDKICGQKLTQFGNDFTITHGKGPKVMTLKKAKCRDTTKACGGCKCHQNTYTIELPGNNKIYVNQGQIMAFAMEVGDKKTLTGETSDFMEGHCGNYNCNHKDDSFKDGPMKCPNGIDADDTDIPNSVIPPIPPPFGDTTYEWDYAANTNVPATLAMMMGKNPLAGFPVRNPKCDARMSERLMTYCMKQAKELGLDEDAAITSQQTCLTGCCAEPEQCSGAGDQFGAADVVCKPFQQEGYKALCERDFAESGADADEHDVAFCQVDCCMNREECPDRDDEGKLVHCTVTGDPHIKNFDSHARDKAVYFRHGDYWLVNSESLQIQGRFGSPDTTAEHKASLMGVAISGFLLGDEDDDGNLPVIEIPVKRWWREGNGVQHEEDKVKINGEDVKKGDARLETPEYSITFGRDLAVVHYFDEKFALDETTGLPIHQGGELKPAEAMNADHTVTIEIRYREAPVARLILNNGPTQDFLIELDSLLTDPDGGVTTGITGQCGNADDDPEDEDQDENDGGFRAGCGGPNNDDSIFSDEHPTCGEEPPPESVCDRIESDFQSESALEKWKQVREADSMACAHFFFDTGTMESFNDDMADCLTDCCNNYGAGEDANPRAYDLAATSSTLQQLRATGGWQPCEASPVAPTEVPLEQECDASDSIWAGACTGQNLIQVDASLQQAEAEVASKSEYKRLKYATWESMRLTAGNERKYAGELWTMVNGPLARNVADAEEYIEIQKDHIDNEATPTYTAAVQKQENAESTKDEALLAEQAAMTDSISCEETKEDVNSRLQAAIATLNDEQDYKHGTENKLAKAEEHEQNARELNDTTCDHAQKKRAEADQAWADLDQAVELLGATQASLESAQNDNTDAEERLKEAIAETLDASQKETAANKVKEEECRQAREADADYNDKVAECDVLKGELDNAAAAKNLARAAHNKAVSAFFVAQRDHRDAQDKLNQANAEVKAAEDLVAEDLLDLEVHKKIDQNECEERDEANKLKKEMEKSVADAVSAEADAQEESRQANETRSNAKEKQEDECEKMKQQRETATFARESQQMANKSWDTAKAEHAKKTDEVAEHETVLGDATEKLKQKTDDADDADEALKDAENRLKDAQAAREKALVERDDARTRLTREDTNFEKQDEIKQDLDEALDKAEKENKAATDAFEIANNSLKEAEDLSKLCEDKFEKGETADAADIISNLTSATLHLRAQRQAYQNAKWHLGNKTEAEEQARKQKEAHDKVHAAAAQALTEANRIFESKSQTLRDAEATLEAATNTVTAAKGTLDAATNAKALAKEEKRIAEQRLSERKKELEKKKRTMDEAAKEHAAKDAEAGIQENTATWQDGQCADATTEKNDAVDLATVANGNWKANQTDLDSKQNMLDSRIEDASQENAECVAAVANTEEADVRWVNAKTALALREDEQASALSYRDRMKKILDDKEGIKVDKTDGYAAANTTFTDATNAHNTCRGEEAGMLNVNNAENQQCTSATSAYEARKREHADKQAAENQRESERALAEEIENNWTSKEASHSADEYQKSITNRTLHTTAGIADQACLDTGDKLTAKQAIRESALKADGDQAIVVSDAESVRDDLQSQLDAQVAVCKSKEEVRQEKFDEAVAAGEAVQAAEACVAKYLQDLEDEKEILAFLQTDYLQSAQQVKEETEANARTHDETASLLEKIVPMYQKFFKQAVTDYNEALATQFQLECMKTKCKPFWRCGKPNIVGLVGPAEVADEAVYNGVCEGDQVFSFCKDGCDEDAVICKAGVLSPTPYCAAPADTQVLGIFKWNYDEASDALGAGYELQIVRQGEVLACTLDAGGYCWDVSGQYSRADRMIRISVLNAGQPTPIKTSFPYYNDNAYRNNQWDSNEAEADITRGVVGQEQFIVVEAADGNDGIKPFVVKILFIET